MNRVIVTGATGFIGCQVLAPLVRRNFEVHALYHRTQPDEPAADWAWHACDLFDEKSVANLFESVQPMGLLHFAWDTTPGSYWTNPANLTWTGTTLRLLEAFRKNGGKRVVIAGSSAEYDWKTDQSLDEFRSALSPQKLYGKCKNALREIVQEWAMQEKISWAWGRIFNVFGPWENPNRLVPKVTRALLAGEEVKFDRGAALRDFMHVADAGEAFAALFASTATGPVNIGSGEAVSIREMVSMIAHQLEKTRQVVFDTLSNPEDEHPRVIASVRRLREEVGWKTSRTLEERLRETCLWWSDYSQDAAVKF